MEVESVTPEEHCPQGEEPCMKTLALKILIRCWSQSYELARNQVIRDFAGLPCPSISVLTEITRTSARKSVTDSLERVMAHRHDSGPELFLRLLEFRCQREILSNGDKFTSTHGVEKEYYRQCLDAWKFVHDTIK